MESFPSLKARQLLRVLRRKPLRYRVVRQKGSHRTLRSKTGYPDLVVAFHDRATVPGGMVRHILVNQVRLGETEARRLV